MSVGGERLLGIALLGDRQGTIIEILRDDFSLFARSDVGRPFPLLVERGSMPAALDLVDDVRYGGPIAGLKVFEDEQYVNDDSKVIAANILASNGVIHAVDTVILGPWPRE